MDLDLNETLYTISTWIIPAILAITMHEAAHGFVAYRFGDRTAWDQGRVTLNPFKHIDPVGTVLLPGALLLMRAPFLFGYAKPVPVRFDRLRHPKRDMIWVALAGPGANLAQALLWGALLYLLAGSGVTERFFLTMCRAGMLVNVVMFALNLFPLPPLDGGRVLVGLLPWRQAMWVSRLEPWGFFIVLGLVITGVLSKLWLRPVMALTYGLLEVLLWPLSFLIR